MSPRDPPPPKRYRLRRRLLVVISLLVALVLAGSVVVVLTAVVSHGAIAAARNFELTSRRAALLSVVAREQYIHEAHTIIVRDHSHVGHHNEWVAKLNRELDGLRSDVDAEGDAKLDRVARASAEMLEIFSASILPAIDRQDWRQVGEAHARVNALVDEMTDHADALAGYFDRRASDAEQEAERRVRFALGTALAFGLVAAALVAGLGRRLWHSLSAPLASLERVAECVAGGDSAARVEPLAAAELAVVADAFNRMLDALARAEADVVASARLAAIGHVAAGVAHEINNPIAVIRGYLKTMHREAEHAQLRDELRILDEEASACQRIAEDLLTYARSPALEPVEVDAAEVLRDAAARSDGGSTKGVGMTNAPLVTVEAEQAVVLVDPLRIRQVVLNLVTNACEATKGGDPVIVRGFVRERAYRIEVLDRGDGIAEGTRRRIFEPFFTTRRDGTGLGLAVCYGLVAAHGGTIGVEPRDGGGSRFVVDLPGVVVAETKGVRT